jgi:hypothetical protein
MSIDEEDIERRVDFLIRELDQFCSMAIKPELASYQIAFGQMQTRIQLILSFLKKR